MLAIVSVVILMVSCDARTSREGYTTNVGSVLFTSKDMTKDRWSKNQIALLRARKHFQNILPPPGFINNFNEDCVHTLLHYFKNAYSNIRSEADDPETDTIMTTALSDSLGGYLKVWVLPVAKLNYYGGTISQENIIRLYLFYDEIKNYIGTDGEGWHNPGSEIINAMTINVAPRMTSNTRSMKNPCDHLAYFEKTPKGLSIPLPNVKWDQRSSTMFVPLRNMSLVPLNSPDKGDTLLKYYDTAKSCIAASNPTESAVFEEKFQQWLTDDIIPHLKDDNLYLSLGSVLTLANKTRNAYNNVMQQCSNKYQILSKGYIPIEITTKKMMILFVILVLEVAWCVPAFIYLLCTKKKKKKKPRSRLCMFLDKNKIKKDKFNIFKKGSHKGIQIVPQLNVRDIETQRPSKLIHLIDANTSSTGKMQVKQPICSEFEAQYPSSHHTIAAGTGSQSYVGSKNQSAEAVIKDVRPMPKKSALKKALEAHPRTVHTARVVPLSSQEKLRRTEKIDNTLPTSEDTGQSSPKKNLHTNGADKKQSIAQKKTEFNKPTKPLSTTKRLERIKDGKSVTQKRSDHNRESKDLSSKIMEKNAPICQPQSALTILKSETEVALARPSPLPLPKSPSIISKATDTDTTDVESSFHTYTTKTPLSCPCTGCMHCTTDVKHEITSKMLGDIVKLTDKTKITEEFSDDKQSGVKATRFHIFREHRSKKAAFKVSDSGKPLFEITIDRPTTEICVDVSSTHKKHQKRSKIPKPRSNIHELVSKLSGRIQRALSPGGADNRKSLIPKLKRRTVDDIVLAGSCKSDIYFNRLNDTI